MSTGEFPDVHAFRVVYDVIVVGAGINGSSAAYHCAKQGLTTLLLEQFSLPHSRGSSHGQSRIIRYSYNQPHYAQMVMEAFPLWRQLEKEADTILYKKTGLLTISEHPEHTLYHDSIRVMRENGLRYKDLDASTSNMAYPEVDIPHQARVFMDYEGGILRANRGLTAFQSQFLKKGGELRDEEPVLEILPGTLVTVVTKKGKYMARKLILTPGAWASKILRPLGLDPPLEVIRINVPYWQEKKTNSMDKMPTVIIEVSDNHHVYALQSLEYPGLTKVAYHGGCDHGIDPDKRDDVLNGDKEEVEFLKLMVAKYFPRLHPEPKIMETCMYTNTPDDELIIDHHPVYPNIIVCCGCSGHGYKLAPSVGRILCNLALGKKSHIDISALSFKRFKNSALVNQAKL